MIVVCGKVLWNFVVGWWLLVAIVCPLLFLQTVITEEHQCWVFFFLCIMDINVNDACHNGSDNFFSSSWCTGLSMSSTVSRWDAILMASLCVLSSRMSCILYSMVSSSWMYLSHSRLVFAPSSWQSLMTWRLKLMSHASKLFVKISPELISHAESPTLVLFLSAQNNPVLYFPSCCTDYAGWGMACHLMVHPQSFDSPQHNGMPSMLWGMAECWYVLGHYL